MRAAAWTLVAAAIGSGCASTRYAPRDLPYLKRVQRSNEILWQAGTRTEPFNPFGDGLARMVADVPEARALADEARSDTWTGVLLAIAGPLVMSGAPALVFATADDPSDLSSGEAILLTTSLLGGMLMTFTGLAHSVSARSRELDAVNVYNDTVWERHGLLPAPQAAPPP